MSTEQDEQKVISEAGRRFAAMRRQVTRACATCGKEITGVATRRYCSAACRVRAVRERRDGRQDTDKTGGDEDVYHHPIAGPIRNRLTPEGIERLREIREKIGPMPPGTPDSVAELRRFREGAAPSLEELETMTTTDILRRFRNGGLEE